MNVNTRGMIYTGGVLWVEYDACGVIHWPSCLWFQKKPVYLAAGTSSVRFSVAFNYIVDYAHAEQMVAEPNPVKMPNPLVIADARFTW